jgi:polyhydroxyalkanoate synthesis regulator phasin
LESDYHALSAALKRIEEKLDRTALRSELLELKARVAALEEKIAELESEVSQE